MKAANGVIMGIFIAVLAISVFEALRLSRKDIGLPGGPSGVAGVQPGWPDPLSQATIRTNWMPSPNVTVIDIAPSKITWTTNTFVNPYLFHIETDYENGVFRFRDFNGANTFTIRVRNKTNVFITTTNEVSCDQFWGPDDKYEVRFWPKEESK